MPHVKRENESERVLMGSCAVFLRERKATIGGEVAGRFAERGEGEEG